MSSKVLPSTQVNFFPFFACSYSFASQTNWDVLVLTSAIRQSADKSKSSTQTVTATCNTLEAPNRTLPKYAQYPISQAHRP